MRKKIIIPFIIAILFISAGTVFALSAQEELNLRDALKIQWETVKDYPFFNKWHPFGAGARPLGMGEAYTAVADDIASIYYNPSGMAQMDHNELHWTGGSYYRGAPYTNFGALSLMLAGQYFGVSYMKLYHPIGYYPKYVVLPGPDPNIPGSVGGTGPNGSIYRGQPVIIPEGRFKWYGGQPEGLDPSHQEFLADKYRKYINPAFQTNSIQLTYATPLTADKSFLFGLNVKYQFTDLDTKKALGDDFDAWAWGLDLGFMYKLRIIEFLKDWNIGIMLRDVSGTIKYYRSGIEKPLYFTSTVATSMRTTEFIENEVTSFSIDFDSVNDPGVFDNERFRLKFGAEQWFIDGHFAVRGGLVDYLNAGPWRMTLGISARYIFGIDYAYMRALPFATTYENEDDSHWVSLHWEWGKVKKKLPTPDVFASVEPISFAPKNGETVIFKVNAYSKAGIDRWVLNILDKDNNLVKSYVDIGAPPTQIVWNGTDNKYQLLPDGEYTFIFEATDKLGSTSSTPVQTLKIFTPVLEGVNPSALRQLKELLKQIADRDIREDNAEAARAKAGITARAAEMAKPTPVPPPPAGTLPEPAFNFNANGEIVPNGVTPGAAAGGAGFGGFPNVDSGAVRSAYIQTADNGDKIFNVEYVTTSTLPQYVMKEMAMMARSIAESVGTSVSNIGINAVYGGNNSLIMNVPVAAAQNYSRGNITAEQMLRGASITLNGERIYPNF